MIGPRGLERVAKSLCVIAPDLPFPIEYIEMTENEEHFSRKGYEITAFRVKHNVVCYGYTIEIKRGGKFDIERAKAQNIPVSCWNPLQKGNTVVLDNRTYTPDMVLGPERKGIKLTYCTDTRPTPVISDMAENADLFICEGMYGETDPETLEKAKPKELWLTHYSPSLNYPENYMKEIRRIFADTKAAKDQRSVTLSFEED